MAIARSMRDVHAGHLIRLPPLDCPGFEIGEIDRLVIRQAKNNEIAFHRLLLSSLCSRIEAGLGAGPQRSKTAFGGSETEQRSFVLRCAKLRRSIASVSAVGEECVRSAR